MRHYKTDWLKFHHYSGSTLKRRIEFA